MSNGKFKLNLKRAKNIRNSLIKNPEEWRISWLWPTWFITHEDSGMCLWYEKKRDRKAILWYVPNIDPFDMHPLEYRLLIHPVEEILSAYEEEKQSSIEQKHQRILDNYWS